MNYLAPNHLALHTTVGAPLGAKNLRRSFAPKGAPTVTHGYYWV
jgi:hypothetical protein